MPLSAKKHGTFTFLKFKFKSRDRADIGSYGEWQDPDLATFKGSRDIADIGSYGEWQDADLANFRASRDRADLGSYGEWQDPDLATFNGKIWILPYFIV